MVPAQSTTSAATISLVGIVSILTGLLSFLLARPAISNAVFSELSALGVYDSTPSTFVLSEQPLLNSIPPELVDRFEPSFVKYWNRYNAGRLNHLSPVDVPFEKFRADPMKYLVLYGYEIVPDVNKTTDYKVPVEKGQITVRVYEPPANGTEPRPVYINYHGGGFVYGGLHFDENFCKRLVHELGIVVVDVDYRLAPQFPFPTPVKDSWLAFSWVSSSFKFICHQV